MVFTTVGGIGMGHTSGKILGVFICTFEINLRVNGNGHYFRHHLVIRWT